jgi:hypothetical protein
VQNCKAAQYSPKNLCTTTCRWPGQCSNGGRVQPPAPVEVAPEPPVEEVVAETTEDISEASDGSVDTETVAKPRRARKTREDA